jgi:hypothetical protein|tara:strand:+ start:2081 stop:2299 length:219 start_codon:yes stop_codon:yes gene_type:complete
MPVHTQELLSNTLRGKFIIAKALYIAHKELGKVTSITERQDSDMADMLSILQESFPSMWRVFQVLEEKEQQI